MRMNRWILAGIGALMVGQASVAMAAAIPWTSNWTNAQAEAKRTGQLIMIDFYATWNPFSIDLEKDVYPDPSVIKAAEQFVPIRLNGETDGRQLAQKYGVTKYPAIIFVDATGQVVDKIGGDEPAPDFAKDLDRIAQDAREFPVLQQRVKTDPSDTAAAAKLARDMIQRGRIAEAKSLIHAVEAHGSAQPELAVPYQWMGDYYLARSDVEPAAPWYRKVLSVTKEPVAVSSAHFKLGVCDIVEKKNADGAAEMNAVIENPDAPKILKEQAQEVLRQLKQKKG